MFPAHAHTNTQTQRDIELLKDYAFEVQDTCSQRKLKIICKIWGISEIYSEK